MAAPDEPARRVLIWIGKSSRRHYPRDNWAAADLRGTIDLALRELQAQKLIPQRPSQDQHVKTIATRIEPKHAMIVFDIFHDDLDEAQAHLPGQDLPVLVASLRQKKNDRL